MGSIFFVFVQMLLFRQGEQIQAFRLCISMKNDNNEDII